MQKFFDCGIDLGTTNSCIAIPDDDHGFVIIENQADRMQVTSSAILINGKGRMLVGQRAYNSQKVEDLAIQFKRAMGTSKRIRFASAGIEKTPEELSAEILKVLRNDAQARLNRPVENVVITVPAAFKTLQSEATNKAGQLAGFQHIILLQEPIAAAVAYGARPDARDKHWMVFDYGGGTLDVAIISTTDNRLTVENSEGDNFFGGSDIDRLIYKKIIYPKLVEEGYQIDRLLDEATGAGRSLVRKILLDCEICKVELSNSQTAVFELFDLDDDEGEPIEFECEITRAELEHLISGTVEKSIQIARKALEGAGLRSSQLDKILLVGGSTFIPLVRQRLVEEFHVALDSSLNPMTVVAAGAAIYASTSVIDVEEEVELTDRRHAVATLTYDPISSEERVNVVGKIGNIEDVPIEKIRIDRAASEDFSGAEWTSGWTELLDAETGIFDVDVLLHPGKLNHFKVYACDERGTDITIENPYFDIKHNANVLKTSAPPATMSIGVQIQDPGTGHDTLSLVIKKNTPLPAKAERTFKLTRNIDPAKADCITIKIWEGENTINPEANHSAGEITVQSSGMDRIIPKGTEIDLTIEEDADRKLRVSGYIPDIDYTIPEHTLRAEAKVDWAESMDKIDDRIKQSEVSLQRLKSQGDDVSELEDELDQMKDSYDDTYDMIDNERKKLFDDAYEEYLKIIKVIELLYQNETANPFDDERPSMTDVECSLDQYLQGVLLKIAVADGNLTEAEKEFILSLPDELDEVCSRNRGYRRFLKQITPALFMEKGDDFFGQDVPPLFMTQIKDEDEAAADDVIKAIEAILNAFAAIDDHVSGSEMGIITNTVSSLRGTILPKMGRARPQPRPQRLSSGRQTGKDYLSAQAVFQTELDQGMEELDRLVGLTEVKQEVLASINLLKVNNLRKEKGLPELQISRHMVFTGQPGTGKTTVARIIAKIYKALGVVSKGQLVETDRAGMVAGYVGQTALKTAQVIKKAKGGVLFIDEAYALSSQEGSNDFGREAIDTLVKGMEDYRDDLVVIVAGYTDEMEAFIRMNPGLRSRFNKVIHFRNYSGDEMLAIFKGLCDSAQFILSREAEEKSYAYFQGHQGDKTFGNARGVRNYFDRVVTSQATRILSLNHPSEEEFRTIREGDVE